MNSPCYNWDRSSWLSSKEYFEELSSQLIEFLDITEEKKILDVGCGRGHLLENLALKANLINQPVGVEPVKHDDFVPQNVKIFHSSINSFLNENNSQFDLVILKQVLHLLTLDERKKFYHDIKNHMNKDDAIERRLFQKKKYLNNIGKVGFPLMIISFNIVYFYLMNH